MTGQVISIFKRMEVANTVEFTFIFKELTLLPMLVIPLLSLENMSNTTTSANLKSHQSTILSLQAPMNLSPILLTRRPVIGKVGKVA